MDMTRTDTAAPTVLAPATATMSQLVRLRTSFMAHIDLDRANDAGYRAQCRDAYLYLPEDGRFFINLVNALDGQLPNRKHVVLEEGPFGVGKSLLNVIR